MSLDISDTDSSWPPEIPENLRLRLEKEIEWFMKIDCARKSNVSSSEVKKEAEALRKSALKLLETFRRFSNDHQIAIYENYREQAVVSLRERAPELGDDEFRLFRTGMNPLSMQFPLIGLAEWADKIAHSARGNDGRRPADNELRAVAEIIRCFEYITFDPTTNENDVLLRTCLAFFARTDNPKSSAAASRYIKDVKEKTSEKILKFSP
jgi:hypothetical protein